MLPGYPVTCQETPNRPGFGAHLCRERTSLAATLSWALVLSQRAYFEVPLSDVAGSLQTLPPDYALGTEATTVLCGSLTLPLGSSVAEGALRRADRQQSDHRAARRAGKRAAFPRRRAVQHAPVVGGLIVPVPPLSCRTDPTLQRGGRRPCGGVSVPRVCLGSPRTGDHRGRAAGGLSWSPRWPCRSC